MHPSQKRWALLRGKDAAPAERLPLRAGPLNLIFEPETAFLRYIRLNDREILRGVYAAVRDRNWGTIAPQLSNLEADVAADAFRLAFDVTCREREIDFFWRGVLSGDADGTITFAMDGVARSTFLRNRIGFCVLHPMDCAGRPCTVEHVDGAAEQGRFPERIAPHQPFVAIRALTHEVLPGLWAEVRMDGDTFEMEDQRNWTDASFKTYCTPLDLPFPVEVAAGTRIQQSVTLALRGQIPTVPSATADTGAAVVTLGAPSGPLPRIGVCRASHGQPLSEGERERLRALNFAHLRVDLHLGTPQWRDTLARAAREADTIDTALEAALFVTDNAEAELADLAGEVRRGGPRIARWLVFHEKEKTTTARWVHLARQALSAAFPDTPIGAGTNAYFTELNRERPPTDACDLACYSINPQVHAFDDASLVETLAAQAETVRSARHFLGNLPIAVTPVTLRPRFNPDATSGEGPAASDELLAGGDVRQRSLLGAGWTLGSIKYLAEGGAASVTCFETTGGRGVMEVGGAVFPLYHVLADVGEFAGGQVRRVGTNQPLAVDGLAIESDGRLRLVIANLSPETQEVHGEGLPPRLRLKRLDESAAETALRAPEAFRSEPGEVVETTDGRLTLRLSPFAIVRLDRAEEPST